MADTLKVTITEALTLNSAEQGGTTNLSITGINHAYKRIVTVPTSEILLYDTHDTNVA